MGTYQDYRSEINVRSLGNVRSRASHAIQSQYSASPHMLALMACFQRRIDIYLNRTDANGNAVLNTADIDLFYDNMFNIMTAAGVGLDNWGQILQMPRAIPKVDFGYYIPDPDAPDYISLDDDDYRLLLLYKAMANIASDEIDALNELLQALIDTGVQSLPDAAYVVETDKMVIRWVFEAYLTESQMAVFVAAGTLARGAGVGWEMYALTSSEVFGFDGGEWQPFGCAPFAPDNSFIKKTQ